MIYPALTRLTSAVLSDGMWRPCVVQVICLRPGRVDRSQRNTGHCIWGRLGCSCQKVGIFDSQPSTEPHSRFSVRIYLHSHFRVCIWPQSNGGLRQRRFSSFRCMSPAWEGTRSVESVWLWGAKGLLSYLIRFEDGHSFKRLLETQRELVHTATPDYDTLWNIKRKKILLLLEAPINKNYFYKNTRKQEKIENSLTEKQANMMIEKCDTCIKSRRKKN